MLDLVIAERLAPRSRGAALFRRVLKITGRAESDVDQHAQPVYGRWTSQPVPISTTILAVLGQIELHLTARATDRTAAEAALETAVGELRAALGDSVYSVDGRPLEAVVGDLLRSKTLTIAVAESCTGGLLAARLTSRPGSSAYVLGGVTSYSNEAKQELLGVPAELIDKVGAVSAEVAQAMADGARARLGADIGVGITGIAGPGGGTEEKPVGLVHLCVTGADQMLPRRIMLPGSREDVRKRAVVVALHMIREALGG
jgi:nicotinamide-nucleotide amidase